MTIEVNQPSAQKCNCMRERGFAGVVVTYNSAGHIRPCLASLRQAGVHVIAVDNGSCDETLRVIAEEFPEVELVSAGENLGYGMALNLGIAKTSSEVVLAANADTVFPEGSLQALARFLQDHARIGVIGPQQLFPDGSWQRSYGDVPSVYEALKAVIGLTSLSNTARRCWRRPRLVRSARRVGYVDGAVMMIRRAAFDEIGGFDEAFPYYGEDADFCLRLKRAGWGVASLPHVEVTHIRGGSSTKVEGYSDKLLRSQAIASCQLVRKHHSDSQVWLYRQLSILHARKTLLIYGLLRILRPVAYSERAATKALAFKRWERILIELKS
jgi:N-acetylglucosaminyl-diphospho-decaprenol L-rhamnosyltransferase